MYWAVSYRTMNFTNDYSVIPDFFYWEGNISWPNAVRDFMEALLSEHTENMVKKIYPRNTTKIREITSLIAFSLLSSYQ